MAPKRAARTLLQTLQTISRGQSPGPVPAFSYAHICAAILTIGDEGPIGRIALSRKLGVGEGTIRTIIKHLTAAETITTVRDGCVLTKPGGSLYKGLRSRFSKIVSIDARELSLDKASAAILIRGSGNLVKRGIEQRDASIRAGATGACTLIVRKGEYVMPMGETEDSRLKPQDPLVQDLEQSFHPKNEDVITIASGPTSDAAEHGAMASALTLLE
jgi:predicted transcriptional regulator